jgi:hypothetical protein
MFALLRKDAPWILFFAVAGSLVVLASLLFADPVDFLLFESSTAEATYWTAVGGGLGLGACAGRFDEVLGTGDLLAQRPLSSRRLMLGRLAGIALVLLAWHTAPLLWLLLWMPFSWIEGLSPSLGNWLGMHAVLAVAWPCAAIALFAASLPLGWLLRLLGAGSAAYVTLLCIDRGLQQRGEHEPAAYLLACLFAGLPFAALALFGSGARGDVDRPFGRVVPAASRWWLVATVAAVWACGSIELEAEAIQRLHRTYPEPWLQQREVVLVTMRGPSWTTRIVDAEHRDTARELTGGKGLFWSEGWPYLLRDNEFDRPRWLDRVRYAYSGAFGGRLLLTSDGVPWHDSLTDKCGRRFVPVEVLPPVARFSRAARLAELGNWPPNRACMVVEPGAAHVWRFEWARNRLVGVSLPGEDRVVRGYLQSFRGLEWLGADELARWRALVGAEAGAGRNGGPGHDDLFLVRGQRGDYALVGDTLREFPRRPEVGPVAVEQGRSDPIVFSRSLPATDAHEAFAHDYRPRTAAEQWLAAGAMLWSTLRPPVLQVAAHVAPADARPGWLFDPLVVGGRRTWLLALQLAFGGLLAWRAYRWQQRFGSRTGTAVWVAQIALFGFAAFVLCVLLERRRRLQEHDGPAPPPLRIGTLGRQVG